MSQRSILLACLLLSLGPACDPDDPPDIAPVDLPVDFVAGRAFVVAMEDRREIAFGDGSEESTVLEAAIAQVCLNEIDGELSRFTVDESRYVPEGAISEPNCGVEAIRLQQLLICQGHWLMKLSEAVAAYDVFDAQQFSTIVLRQLRDPELDEEPDPPPTMVVPVQDASGRASLALYATRAFQRAALVSAHAFDPLTCSVGTLNGTVPAERDDDDDWGLDRVPLSLVGATGAGEALEQLTIAAETAERYIFAAGAERRATSRDGAEAAILEWRARTNSRLELANMWLGVAPRLFEPPEDPLTLNPDGTPMAEINDMIGELTVCDATARDASDDFAEDLLRGQRIDPRLPDDLLEREIRENELLSDLRESLEEDYPELFGDSQFDGLGDRAFFDNVGVEPGRIFSAADRIETECEVLGRSLLPVPSEGVQRYAGTQRVVGGVDSAFLFAKTGGNARFDDAMDDGTGRPTLDYDVDAVVSGDELLGYSSRSVLGTIDAVATALAAAQTRLDINSWNGGTNTTDVVADLIGRIRLAARNTVPNRIEACIGAPVDDFVEGFRVRVFSDDVSEPDRVELWLGEAGLQCATSGNVEGVPCDPDTVRIDATRSVFDPGLDDASGFARNAIELSATTRPDGESFSNTDRIYVTYWQRFGEDDPEDALGQRRIAIGGFGVSPGERDDSLFSRCMLLPAGVEVGRRLEDIMGPSASTCESPMMTCAGVPLDVRLPLEDELTEAATGRDDIESSFIHYLRRAREAADEADRLGEELIARGLESDLRAEAAADELERLCGAVVNLDSLPGVSPMGAICADESDCSTGFGCISGTCQPRNLDALFDEEDADLTALHNCIGESLGELRVATVGSRPLCYFRFDDRPICDCPDGVECPTACPAPSNRCQGDNTDPAYDALAAMPGVEVAVTETLDIADPNVVLPGEGSCDALQRVIVRAGPIDGVSPVDSLLGSADGTLRAVWLNQLSMGRAADLLVPELEHLGFLTIRAGGRRFFSNGSFLSGPITGVWPCEPRIPFSTDPDSLWVELCETGGPLPLACGSQCGADSALDRGLLETVRKPFGCTTRGDRECAILFDRPAPAGTNSAFYDAVVDLRAITGRDFRQISWNGPGDQSPGCDRDTTCTTDVFIEPLPFGGDSALCASLGAVPDCLDPTNAQLVRSLQTGTATAVDYCLRTDVFGPVPWPECDGFGAPTTFEREARFLGFFADDPRSINDLADAWAPGGAIDAAVRRYYQNPANDDLVVPNLVGTRFVEDVTHERLMRSLEMGCLAQGSVASGCSIDPGQRVVVRSPEDLDRLGQQLACAADGLESLASQVLFPDVPEFVVEQVRGGGIEPTFTNFRGEAGETVAELRAAMEQIQPAVYQIASVVRDFGAELRIARSRITQQELQEKIDNWQLAAELANQVARCVNAGAGLRGNPQTAGSASQVQAVECAAAAVNVAAAVATSIFQRRIGDEEIEIIQSGAALAFGARADELVAAEESLRTTFQRINALLARLDGIRREARRAAARVLFLGTDEAGREYNVNAVMRSRLNTLRIRYERAHVNAIRMAYLARRAVEQRVGFDLSEMHDDMTLVPPPATWADGLCSMDGIDYGRLRADLDGESGDYADAFVGDYVTLLENFIDSYRIDFPFQDGDDVAVVSLRDELLGVRAAGERESYNLLLQTTDPRLAPWSFDCIPGQRCPLVTESDDTPFLIELEGPSEAPALAARARTLGGGAAYDLTSACPEADPDMPGLECGIDVDGALVQDVELFASTSLLSWYERLPFDLTEDATTTCTSSCETACADDPDPGCVAECVEPCVIETCAMSPAPASGLDLVAVGSLSPLTTSTPIEVDASDDIWLDPCRWRRFFARVDTTEPQTARVGFQVFRTTSAGPDERFVVGFSSPQLEELTAAEASASVGPRPFFWTDSDRFVEGDFLGEDVDGDVFRSSAYWTNGCEYICPDGLGDTCAAGEVPDRSLLRCYRETFFTIAQDAIERGEVIPAGGFAVGNFNYRHGQFAMNLVGTNVVDCEQADLPSSCYASGFVPYSLRHDEPFTVRNHLGEEYDAPLFVGNVEFSKALSAERFLTNPLSSADRALLQDYYRGEFEGRPIPGVYRLRVYDVPGLQWDNVEDIQVVLNYRYWTRFE